MNKVRVLEDAAEDFTDNTSAYTKDNTICLKSTDKILELELTLLDYERAAENRYAYKIEGHQEQWVYTTANTISVINPPYGRYNLIIKARGASGSWSADRLRIPVYVPLPFYLQWWFIASAVLLVIAVSVAGVQWRVRKLKKDRSRLENEVEKRTYKIEQDKQTIEKQAEELKALDKAKTRFFANITHEFRTPLTLVAGPVEQIIAEQPPAPIKKRLNGVLKNARNLMSLINQLLDLSKLEGGRMKVEISHGDIIHYTRELLSHFQPLADKKQLQLEFNPYKAMWKIHTDIDKWTKIVHNLLSNAIKFTPGGGRVSLSLEQVQQDGQDHIQLKVKDTGIGIAAESLDHVFNRFYQADASSTRLQGGTGIGLSLVKELAELQNGAVSVESVLGKGSVFTVSLPLATAPETASMTPMPVLKMVSLPDETVETAPENEQAATGIAPMHREKHGEKLQLLIVEDHAEMRAYIRSCINASVYHISEAADGVEGIAKAQEIVPDLIISDVMMPEKDGFEVAKAIRGHIATSHIPIILLTAKASLESRLTGLKRGADAYLTKPFSPEKLTLRIQKLIELRKLLQARYQSDTIPEARAEFEKEDGFIGELRAYIISNIDQSDLGVKAISHHFAISRIQLYRKLKSLTNSTIADFVRSIRLNTAMQLLKERQLSISEIAYKAGFSSPGHFSRVFKNAYGKPPSGFL